MDKLGIDRVCATMPFPHISMLAPAAGPALQNSQHRRNMFPTSRRTRARQGPTSARANKLVMIEAEDDVGVYLARSVPSATKWPAPLFSRVIPHSSLPCPFCGLSRAEKGQCITLIPTTETK